MRICSFNLWHLLLPGKPDNPIALISQLSAETLRGSAIFPPIRSAVYPASLDRQPRILSIQNALDLATPLIAIERSEDDPERLFEAWIDAAALPAAEPQWPTSPRDHRTRVLFFSNYSGYSGAAETLVETVRALPPEQFDKLAFIPVPGLFSHRMSALGCQILEWLRTRHRLPLSMSEFGGPLFTLKPDVLHLTLFRYAESRLHASYGHSARATSQDPGSRSSKSHAGIDHRSGCFRICPAARPSVSACRLKKSSCSTTV